MDDDTVDPKILLEVQLFGPPKVTWVDRPLPVSRRQVRALLYRLAADQRPVPREQLCFLFWPDTPESSARRKLTGLVNHLRRSLPTPELLITDDDQVRLDPERTWSDTVAFDRWGAQAGTLERAVGLYRGRFLEGFSLPDSPEYEMWAALERQTWERRYLDDLARLIKVHAANQAYDAAIRCARDYLAADELAEDIHRRLIELYAAAGDRSSALRQFDECVAILERELGVQPLPQTQAVYHAILDSQPLPSGVPDATPGWTILPSVNVGLVGREAALQQLAGAYDEAVAGRGRTVLISGEPGIGKSRLIREFTSRRQAEALVLAGTGHRDTQTMPYQPMVEALRPALRENYPWFEVSPSYLAEAAQLLPELHALYPDLASPAAGQGIQLRSRLFEALSNLTLALADGPDPLLLCLDDLQWADRTTLDWLAYLGRRIGDRRLLLVGAYRTEEAGAIAELRRGLSRLGSLSEVKLSGLDEAAILQGIRHAHGGKSVSGDRAAASRLQAVTGGNPFFFLETLRALLELDQPMQALSHLEDLPLPATVVEVVETRVGRLSPTARQVLEAGAVLGQTFTFELVQRTSGRRELETIDGLDELTDRHLLMEQPAGYRFVHEIIQMAVVRGLSHWRRRLLHRRAAEALEGLQPENAAALARHLAQAEEPGRAAVYALQAGRAAKTLFAHVEARSHFDRALDLLRQEAASLQEPEALVENQAFQVEALYERGWALRLVGDMDAYAGDLDEVARLAESLADPSTLAHLHWRIAYTHRWFCRYPQALEAAEKGLCLSQQTEDRLLEARCWREIGLAARETGDYGAAESALERSLALFTDLGEVVHRILTLGNLATLAWYLRDYPRSMELAQQALDLCEEAELPFQRRLPLGDLGAAAAALGDADLARRCLEESLSISREITDRSQEILCLLHLGWLSIRQKEPAAALQHLQAGLELAERVGSCTEQGWLLCGLAEAHLLMGDRPRAEQHARRALKRAGLTGRPYDEGLARRLCDRLKQDGKAR
ncbi:MAG: AAA family ATPase [Anaerolineae bacterium]